MFNKAKIASVALAATMAVGALGAMPVMAGTYGSGTATSDPTLAGDASTYVTYNADDYSKENGYNDFIWSVPAKQEFKYHPDANQGSNTLTTTGDVKISPLEGKDKLILAQGADIKISVDSANAYKLKPVNDANGDSHVDYTVAKSGTIRGEGTDAAFVNGSGESQNVLEFKSGVAADITGVTQQLTFATTAENIQNGVTEAGEHADQLTFTMDANAEALSLK